MSTSLTVALCTHNHRERLARTLDDLRNLNSPECGWELLIVDNACTDGTPQFLEKGDWRRKGMPMRVVQEKALGLSNARNRAIREAAGEYIIFIDDDETPDVDWLRAYEGAIVAQRPDAMGGRIDVMFEDGERPNWLQDELLGFIGKLDYGLPARRLVTPDTPVFGGNFAFRKALFERIGVFDTGLGRKGTMNIGTEDTDMYQRMIAANCTVWWVPQALIFHRIQAGKLRRAYFLELHFQQGRLEGMRKRGHASRLPPRYLVPQLWRAAKAAGVQRFRMGGRGSLRKEMNVAYFVGYLFGWACQKEACE